MGMEEAGIVQPWQIALSNILQVAVVSMQENSPEDSNLTWAKHKQKCTSGAERHTACPKQPQTNPQMRMTSAEDPGSTNVHDIATKARPPIGPK